MNNWVFSRNNVINKNLWSSWALWNFFQVSDVCCLCYCSQVTVQTGGDKMRQKLQRKQEIRIAKMQGVGAINSKVRVAHLYVSPPWGPVHCDQVEDCPGFRWNKLRNTYWNCDSSQQDYRFSKRYLREWLSQTTYTRNAMSLETNSVWKILDQRGSQPKNHCLQDQPGR